MKTMPPRREMIRAYQRRDASYDGIFFLAVRTTGIFCRPSCPAVKPLPRNVEFFNTTTAAERAGYRPCKRCRPLHTNGQAPAWVARLLQQMQLHPDQRLTDRELRTRQLQPATVRRYFKEHYGMTFQAYQRQQRIGSALTQLQQGSAVTPTSLASGFESESGFRDAFRRIIGQPPGTARHTACRHVELLTSPIGPLLVVATEQALCRLDFVDRQSSAAQLQKLVNNSAEPLFPGSNAVLKQLQTELDGYFAGNLQQFTVPLSVQGTDFQMRVWKALQNIPYGQTLSYGQLAEKINRPNAQRAVGMANHNNRIAILIPCHRVVNHNGQLGGYGGGLWRKQFLLNLEQQIN
ncbi:MAG: Bifunctional transcriptional activator/DNA repair enzyme Ada [Phycisphaerae bacterium]|nr:Bifunctional transcriptional activator/DNA repair enzyme Ada [Phycisphaerae bacterium]